MPVTATEAPHPSEPTSASTRPDPSGPRDSREPTADWPQLIRALAATDDDELPVFGRFPA
jgi:hypothetical protein